jgi:hypothetical protein
VQFSVILHSEVVLGGSLDIEVAGYNEKTDIGGEGEAFLTTHWSLIEGIKSEEDRHQALTDLLLKRYWKPVYCCVRKKGYDNEQAKDLTQGFFHEVVLNRNLVQRADQCKGRFRSFLQHALNQYIIDQRLKQTIRKNIPPSKLTSLEIIESADLPETVSKLNAEDSYNYAWLSAMLDHVISQVRAGCVKEGMELHWNIFNERLVQPILKNTAAPNLAEICEKYGIADQKKASNMATTVKRRFRTALKRYVRNTVISGNQVHEELKEIRQFFPENAQHLE